MLRLARHTDRPVLCSPLLTGRLVHEPPASIGPNISHRALATASTPPKESPAYAPSLARSLAQSQSVPSKAVGRVKNQSFKKKEKQVSSPQATQLTAEVSAPRATESIKGKAREPPIEPGDRVVRPIHETSPKALKSIAGSAKLKYPSHQAPWQVLREAFAQEMAEQASLSRPQPSRPVARRPMLTAPYKKANTTDRDRGKAATSPTARTRGRRPEGDETQHTLLRPPSHGDKKPQTAAAAPVMKTRTVEARALEAIVDNGRSPTSNAPSGKVTKHSRHPAVLAGRKNAAGTAAGKVPHPLGCDGKPPRRSIPRLSNRRESQLDPLEGNLEAYSYSTPVGGWSIPCYQNTERLLPPTFFSAPSAKPALAVTSHVEEADDLLRCIPLGTPLGLDAEWNVDFRSGVISKTALLQICSPTLIVIIQCRRMKSLPPRLVELLQDPGTIKTGVAVVADCRRLQRDFQVTAQGILELGSVAKSVDAERWRTSNGLIGLSTLCRVYLDRRLMKDSVRTSDWEGPLSKQQIQYAASDAFVALEILGKLCSFTAQSGGEQAGVKAMQSRSPEVIHDEDDMAVSTFMGSEHLRASAVARKRSTAGSGLSKNDAIDLADSSGDEGSTIAEEVFLEKSKRSDWFVRPHYSHPQKSIKPSRRQHKNIYRHIVHLSAEAPAAHTPVKDSPASK